jgi:hypothetical protein
MSIIHGLINYFAEQAPSLSTVSIVFGVDGVDFYTGGLHPGWLLGH